MHLKSNNGAIDVLVCPEDETQASQCLQSPPAPVSTANGFCMARSVYSSILPSQSSELVADSVQSRMQQHHQEQHHQQQQQKQQQCPVGQLPGAADCHRQEQAMGLDVEQSVVAPSFPRVTVTGSASNDLDISLSSAADVNTDDLGFMDRLLPLDMAVFDHLSPTTLQTEDFSFSMDNSTEGIHDLFDL